MEKMNLGIPDNIIVKIPENCGSCENVRIINGKTYCGFCVFGNKPFEVNILSETRHPDCRLHMLQTMMPIKKTDNEEFLAYLNKKPTNADKIRNMSDEELAKFLEELENLGYCDDSIAENLDMLEWLQREVDES